jgi:hypothetical protein
MNQAKLERLDTDIKTLIQNYQDRKLLLPEFTRQVTEIGKQLSCAAVVGLSDPQTGKLIPIPDVS